MEFYKISEDELDRITSKINIFSTGVILWLRENRDYLLQEDIDKILSITQVCDTQLQTILQSYRKILIRKDGGKLAITKIKSLTSS